MINHCFYKFSKSQLFTILLSSIAIVIGPTPPGTGVILSTFFNVSSLNSTSPHMSFYSDSAYDTKFIPTSITIAPGLIHSLLTI